MFCRVEFRLEFIAAVAVAGALGAAALDHETFDDAMEDEAVVEADLAKCEEVLDVPRREVGHELQSNWPLVGGQLDGVGFLGEVDVLLSSFDFGLAIGFVHSGCSFGSCQPSAISSQQSVDSPKTRKRHRSAVNFRTA